MVLLKDSQDQMAKEVVKESDDLDSDEILNNHQHSLVHGTDIDQEGNLQEDHWGNLHESDSKGNVWINKAILVVDDVLHTLHGIHVLFSSDHMNNQRDTKLAESFPSVSLCLCNLDIEAFSV